MKSLIIGSTVCDVVVKVERLPKIGEDENIIQQSLHIGGCAFNVSSMLSLFECQHTLFSPVGTGIYGDFVRNHLENMQRPIEIEANEKNGCCYCIVDKSGERTFICEHGAEYFFKAEWFERLDVDTFDNVYICGLEIEETTGEIIISFLEQNPQLQIFFAPGPRIHHIDSNKLERLFALHPILHLNKREILSFTNETDINQACLKLTCLTNNSVIVTLGEEGCYFMEDRIGNLVPTQSAIPVDTIGAGDGHIGTIIACLNLGKSLKEAVITANIVSRKIIQQQGATLTKEDFLQVKETLIKHEGVWE